MLFQKLTEEEIQFMEMFHDPTALTECLIPVNFKAPHVWSEEDCELITLRPYQFAMQDYSYMYADDDKLSAQENFENKRGAGFIINVAARNLGKSFFVIIDAFLTLLHGEADESCVASFDFAHLKKICTPIANLANHHPIFNLYKRKGKECVRFTGGGMEIDTIFGHVMYGRNENISSPDPGTAFHSLHVKKNIYDEVSYMSDEGRKKMVDAVSSEGCIERLAGIPDIRLGSPLGRILRDETKKNWICNLPQTIRADWNEKAKARAIEEYGGESSLDYQLNVLGEPIEGANSMFDMVRIKEGSYKPNKTIKQFEIGKDTFHKFKEIIIIDKVPAEMTLISSDVGTTGSPSELCIFFGDNNLLKWRYNIPLFMLTTQEQAQIFKWLYDKFDNSIISLDCSVHPDEFVLIKVDNKIKYIRFSNLENLSYKSLSVPTFINNKLEWKSAILSKHQFNGKIGKVTVSPGNYSVKVTDNHSVMIYTTKGLVQKELKDCKIGDWMICPKNFKLNNDYQILQYQSRDINKYVHGEWNNIKLNEELAYFLGWCCAEGCSKTTNYQLTLGNEPNEANYLLKLSKKIFNLNSGKIRMLTPEYVNSKLYNKKTAYVNRYTLYLGGGKHLLEFIEKLVGRGSHNKKIPDEIFSSPISVQRAFLNGYTHGDGHCKVSIEGNTNFSIGTVSEQSAKGLILLLQLLGEFPTISYKQKEKVFTVYWSDRYRKGQWTGIPNELIGIAEKKNRKSCKTESLSYIKEHGGDNKKIDNFLKLYNGDWCFRKISSIDYEEYNGSVYDLEVEDNHTFVAGCGNLLVHNTAGDGRSIADELEILGVPKDRIVRVMFNSKMIIGFEMNDAVEGQEPSIQLDDKGDPIYKIERTIDFANMQLEYCLYNGLLEIPHSEKFLREFANYFCVNTGTSRRYGTSSTDHLLQTMQCAVIARFQNEFSNKLKQKPKDTFIGGF